MQISVTLREMLAVFQLGVASKCVGELTTSSVLLLSDVFGARCKS